MGHPISESEAAARQPDRPGAIELAAIPATVEEMVTVPGHATAYCARRVSGAIRGADTSLAAAGHQAKRRRRLP